MSRLRTLLVAVGVAVCAAGAMARQPGPPTGAAYRLTLDAAVTALAPLNGAPAVVAGLEDGSVIRWEARNVAPATFKPHASKVLAVGSTADGRELWSVGADGVLARTATATGAKPTTRKIDLGPVSTRAAAFAPDASRLFAGGEFGEIRVFDTATGAIRQQLRGHRTELQDLAAASWAPLLASASAESDLRVWDAVAGRELAVVDSDLSVFAVAFNPRDRVLASGGADRTVTFRAGATFSPAGAVKLAAPKMVASLAWSPDGRVLALGDLDDETLAKGGLQLLDAATHRVAAVLETGGVPAARLAFAGDTLVVAASGKLLRAWTVALPR